MADHCPACPHSMEVSNPTPCDGLPEQDTKDPEVLFAAMRKDGVGLTWGQEQWVKRFLRGELE